MPAAEFAASSVPEVAAQIDVAVGGLDKRIAADGICRGGRRCVGWLGARLGAVVPFEYYVIERRILAEVTKCQIILCRPILGAIADHISTLIRFKPRLAIAFQINPDVIQQGDILRFGCRRIAIVAQVHV